MINISAHSLAEEKVLALALTQEIVCQNRHELGVFESILMCSWSPLYTRVMVFFSKYWNFFKDFVNFSCGYFLKFWRKEISLIYLTRSRLVHKVFTLFSFYIWWEMKNLSKTKLCETNHLLKELKWNEMEKLKSIDFIIEFLYWNPNSKQKHISIMKFIFSSILRGVSHAVHVRTYTGAIRFWFQKKGTEITEIESISSDPKDYGCDWHGPKSSGPITSI